MEKADIRDKVCQHEGPSVLEQSCFQEKKRNGAKEVTAMSEGPKL